jgi:hypothetical protein
MRSAIVFQPRYRFKSGGFLHASASQLEDFQLALGLKVILMRFRFILRAELPPMPISRDGELFRR